MLMNSKKCGVFNARNTIDSELNEIIFVNKVIRLIDFNHFIAEWIVDSSFSDDRNNKWRTGLN